MDQRAARQHCPAPLGTIRTSPLRNQPVEPSALAGRYQFRSVSAFLALASPLLVKVIPLVPTLSIVLPVHNVERTLAEQVCHLLEMLPDLAERFELLIVDDGSTDHTREIAEDLAQQFPQLRLVRHPRRRGTAAAIQTGMDQTTGEFVMVQDIDDPISARDLRRLWEMRHDEDLVIARAEPEAQPIDAGLISRLMNWGRGVERAANQRPATTGTQMIRRDAVRELERNPSLQNLRIAREHGAEKIARIIPRRKGTGMVRHLRDFALGE